MFNELLLLLLLMQVATGLAVMTQRGIWNNKCFLNTVCNAHYFLFILATPLPDYAIARVINRVSTLSVRSREEVSLLMETLTRDYYAFNNPLTVPGCGEPASFYFRFHIEKPIVRSGFPHGIKRWLPTPSIMRKAQASQVTFNEAIKQLQRQRIWTTSAQQAVRDATSIITRSHTLADHKETTKEQSTPFEVATILCQDETNDNSDTEKKKYKGDEEEEEEGVEEKQKEKNNKSDDDSGGDANVEQRFAFQSYNQFNIVHKLIVPIMLVKLSMMQP